MLGNKTTSITRWLKTVFQSLYPYFAFTSKLLQLTSSKLAAHAPSSSVHYCLFNNMWTQLKQQLCTLLPSIISNNGSSLQWVQLVMSVGCDWLISIDFILQGLLIVIIIMIDSSKKRQSSIVQSLYVIERHNKKVWPSSAWFSLNTESIMSAYDRVKIENWSCTCSHKFDGS